MEELDVIIKQFDSPDEIKVFDKGSYETVTINNMIIGRATYEPGWKWSEHVGPLIGKDFCDVEHVGIVVSGFCTAAFPDGEVTTMKPGDIFFVPSSPHDSWVVGDEPYVSIHFVGADKYTK